MMLNYSILFINKSQVKITSWSKDGHNGYLLTIIHYLEAKPGPETWNNVVMFKFPLFLYHNPHPCYLDHSPQGKLEPLNRNFHDENPHVNMICLTLSIYPDFYCQIFACHGFSAFPL